MTRKAKPSTLLDSPTTTPDRRKTKSEVGSGDRKFGGYVFTDNTKADRQRMVPCTGHPCGHVGPAGHVCMATAR